MRRKLTQRPENFTIKQDHSLAQGLVFAGLGGFPGSLRYDDASGYGNHGTLTNGVTWEADTRYGFVPYSDNSSTEYISTTVSPGALSTFSCHIKYTASQSNPAISMWATVASGSTHRLFSTGSVGLSARVYRATTAVTATVGTLTLNNWSHVAFLFSAASADVYVNARYITTLTPGGGDLNTITGYRLLGNEVASQSMTGSLANVLVHSRLLSPAEIQQLADPSNTMLSGLVEPPKRKLWPIYYTPQTLKRKYLILSKRGSNLLLHK